MPLLDEKVPFLPLSKMPFSGKRAFLECESALLFKKTGENASIGRLQMTFILKSIKFVFSLFPSFCLFFSSFFFFRLFRVRKKGHISNRFNVIFVVVFCHFRLI